jgi:hypothetical protein
MAAQKKEKGAADAGADLPSLPSIRLAERYKLRPIRSLDTWDVAGWRLKVYGIAYQNGAPRPELMMTARRLALECLPQPALAQDRYGVGFIGIHDGRGANFIFVDWWANENELHHHSFSAPGDELVALAPVEGAVACVWDLRVLEFERHAWLETVLTNRKGPDLDAYFARRLNEDA